MTQERIGGHEGLTVLRRPDGTIAKVAEDEAARAALARERDALRLMDGVHAPHVLGYGPDSLLQNDLTGAVFDPDEAWLRAATIRLLSRIRSVGLRHGDLSGSNLIVRPDGLWAIDWQESHLLELPMVPGKRLTSDSAEMMRYLWESGKDTSRIAQRWFAILRDLGALQHDDARPLPLRGRSLVDLGTYRGDFAALAATEGMHAIGIDRGGLLPGENSIENSIAVAVERWDTGLRPRWQQIGGSLRFERRDLLDYSFRRVHVALCLSTWPYMVLDYGQERAEAWLQQAIWWSEVLYFETQLRGDGPGPDFLPDPDSVASMLRRLGATEVRSITALPVIGRDAIRTIWHVEGRR